MSAQDAFLSLALKNKSTIQSHMKQHQETWGPSLPEVDNLAAPLQVFVRVRPLLPRDIKANAYSLILDQPPRTIHFTHPTMRWAGGRFGTKTFDADGVFGESATNDEVYRRMDVRKSLEECIYGRSDAFCIMAYGQTGTGKTYTTTSIEEGMTKDIFTILDGSNDIAVSLGAFEIRGSGAFDLLSDPPHAPIQIQAASAEGMTYPGLSQHVVESAEELSRLISAAKDLRLTRSTVKNDTSSRSHCIVHLNFARLGDGTSSDVYIVDLAGSERSTYMTKNDPERVKESIETNKALAALKECIRAKLTPSTKHIPWRGSKLTMVLRKVFENSGGKDKTSRLAIFACVSPSVIDSEDTLGTLKYIIPFQLSGKDYLDDSAATVGSNSSMPGDIDLFNHEESLAYLTRYLPKLAPVQFRLLPDADSTLESLLQLSLAEFTSLICTPRPGEAAGMVDPRVISRIRPWIEGYHRKLMDRGKKNDTSGARSDAIGVRRVGGTNNAALLSSLNGLDLGANETGFVTRTLPSGKTVQLKIGEDTAVRA